MRRFKRFLFLLWQEVSLYLMIGVVVLATTILIAFGVKLIEQSFLANFAAEVILILLLVIIAILRVIEFIIKIWKESSK